MKKYSYLLAVALLFGCFTRGPYITQEKYNNIQVGESISEVEKVSGEPYSVRKNAKGEKVYEYVETFSTGTELIYENHYFFVVRDGKVIEKKMTQEQDPAFDMVYQDDPNHHYYP